MKKLFCLEIYVWFKFNIIVQVFLQVLDMLVMKFGWMGLQWWFFFGLLKFIMQNLGLILQLFKWVSKWLQVILERLGYLKLYRKSEQFFLMVCFMYWLIIVQDLFELGVFKIIVVWKGLIRLIYLLYVLFLNQKWVWRLMEYLFFFSLVFCMKDLFLMLNMFLSRLVFSRWDIYSFVMSRQIYLVVRVVIYSMVFVGNGRGRVSNYLLLKKSSKLDML